MRKFKLKLKEGEVNRRFSYTVKGDSYAVVLKAGVILPEGNSVIKNFPELFEEVIDKSPENTNGEPILLNDTPIADAKVDESNEVTEIEEDIDISTTDDDINISIEELLNEIDDIEELKLIAKKYNINVGNRKNIKKIKDVIAKELNKSL